MMNENDRTGLQPSSIQPRYQPTITAGAAAAEIGSAAELARRDADQLPPWHDLTADQIVQGIVLSEILGPPAAHRRRKY